MALLLALLALSSSLISLASGSFSVFLPESLPQQYSQQQEGSSVYWPDSTQGQEDDDDSAYRYHHSYESSYRQQIQSIPYTTSYPNTYTVQANSVYQQPNSVYQQPNSVYQQPNSVYQQPNSVYQQPSPVYQQVPPSSVHTYQLADPASLPHASGVLPGRIPTPSLPVYQLVTIGPEVPVLVRLPNQQTAILPVRTVYTLPGFLERIVQRVQNFYSVYNPLEVLKIPRANASQPLVGENNGTSSTTAASTSTSTTAASATESGVTTSVESEEPAAPATTTAPVEDTTTDSNNISAESTTSE